MKNVLLLKCQSQYDAIRYYIDEIEIGFRLAGYNTIILNGSENSSVFQAMEVINSLKIDYIFTCNCCYHGLAKIIPDVVYITYLCDHPISHMERLLNLGENAIVFTVDALHAKYIEKYFPNIKHVMFVPLSGSYSTKYVPYSERIKDVIFTGTYSNPTDIYQKILSTINGGVWREIVEYMLDDIIKNPENSIEDSLERALKIADIEVSEKNFNEFFSSTFWVDGYARNYFRDKVIRILIENGIKVHVFGNGWEKFESRFLNNLVIEKGNSYVARKAVANAKISLNIMPWFKAGFQERIATAMLSGTVAVTDESQYINENFKDGIELITYSLKNLEELPAKIKYILESSDLAQTIANAGKSRAENELTWQHRTFEMINFIRNCTGEELLDNANSYGNILRIEYQSKNNRMIAIDAIKDIDNILDLIQHIQIYDKMDLCDVKYIYTRFLYLYLRLKENFPEIEISDFVYEYIMNLTEENLYSGIELLILECTNIQSVFLKAEYNVLIQENKKKENEASDGDGGVCSQEVLIQKILKNYKNSVEEDILEILEVIKERKFVSAYNQRFISKYIMSDKEIENVYYDNNVDMCYVIINGKKMYYPRSHSKEYIATEINFVNLEQDEKSPHRYLDEKFNVKEGDVVIDAGVAEGNFALEIVEKAKKIYLVECEHEWVEALEKTFEPWKEKVVIIEKMLGEIDDDTHISIDSFVQEDEINFIKMDVEGAEIESLKGASKILKNSRDIKCAICAYHRKNAERDIRRILEEYGFYTKVTKGYIFFKEDKDSWTDGELRRGIVRAVKLLNEDKNEIKV